MNLSRRLAFLLVGLCAVVLMAACGGTSTGSGNTGTPSANTQAPTATANPKPKTMPHFTVDSCNHLMSLDEMNTIFQPPAPAKTIIPTNGDTGGACNYEVSKGNIPLIIYFFEWHGPVPIPENDIAQALAEAAGNGHITVNTFTEVSGIAQQAAYLEATGTDQGVSFPIHIFYVLEGAFFFDCFTYAPLSAGFLGTQDQLQQCATQVDSRL